MEISVKWNVSCSTSKQAYHSLIWDFSLPNAGSWAQVKQYQLFGKQSAASSLVSAKEHFMWEQEAVTCHIHHPLQ